MASEDNIPIVDPTAEPTPGSVSNIFTFSNTLLVVIVAYLLYKIFGRSKPEEEEKPFIPPPPLPKHDMTLTELKKYNGTGPDKRVCIAVLGRVYDVSKGYKFYGPGGAYSTFAGHDSTRALAKFDVMAVKDEWDDVSDLTPSEMSSVEEWREQFDERYDFVGKLVRSEEEITENVELDDSSKSNDSKGDN